MNFVYILKSKKDRSYYIGHTTNIRKRLKEHNEHKSKYTSQKAPFLLVWAAIFKTPELAIRFERYLKSSSGFAFRNKHLI
ncbi:MAG TPA: GIY-YIG nuclease family protein [Candidatus Nanoarchaeia archaeon]|nr:GIY-YIG nuclease family protein [Candidatus Nanoarchaeia archaeon]